MRLRVACVSAGGGMQEDLFNPGSASPRSDRALTTITCRWAQCGQVHQTSQRAGALFPQFDIRRAVLLSRLLTEHGRLQRREEGSQQTASRVVHGARRNP